MFGFDMNAFNLIVCVNTCAPTSFFFVQSLCYFSPEVVSDKILLNYSFEYFLTHLHKHLSYRLYARLEKLGCVICNEICIMGTVHVC